MGTSFSYVCLTHDPVLTSEADVHGHGHVDPDNPRVTELQNLWKFHTGRASHWTGPVWPSMEDWLKSHRRCRVGVVDGYGGMVELTTTVAENQPPASPKTEPNGSGYDDVPAPAYPQPCRKQHPWMSNVWCTQNPHPDVHHIATSTDDFGTQVTWSTQ